MSNTSKDQLYDVYIIEKSGIPLVAGCTATKYCKSHMNQHELQSGFLAALHAFGEEAFEEEAITSLELNNVQINFESDDSHDLIFGLVHPIAADKHEIHKKLQKVKKRFIELYEPSVDGSIKSKQLHDQTREILKETGLVTTELVSVRHMQETATAEKSGILNWIRSKLRSR